MRFGLRSLLFPFMLSMAIGFVQGLACADNSDMVKGTSQLHNDSVGDQDDLCFWNNAKESSEIRVIVSDKKANLIFTYSLDGRLTQSIQVAKPGNIDVRQGVAFGAEPIDVVAVNLRSGGWKIRLFLMDSDTRQLVPIDDGGIPTRPNYGFCLACDSNQEKLFGICTSEDSGVTQYEISRKSNGNCEGREVKHWDLGKCEGVVADDAAGKFYVAVETEGIWQFNVDPSIDQAPELVIPLGKDGLGGDLEGMTLVKLPDGSHALVVSSQGKNEFFVFERFSPWNYRGKFSIEGVVATDGIDLIQSDQITSFPEGIFGCHSAQAGHPIVLSSWRSIVNQMNLGSASSSR